MNMLQPKLNPVANLLQFVSVLISKRLHTDLICLPV